MLTPAFSQIAFEIAYKWTNVTGGENGPVAIPCPVLASAWSFHVFTCGERQMLAIARARMVPAKLILLDEPFEGLAPAVVKEVMDALVRLRGRVAMVLVEHHAETVLPLVDRAYVLVNGQIAFDSSARTLERDPALQARLLGAVHQAMAPVS